MNLGNNLNTMDTNGINMDTSPMSSMGAMSPPDIKPDITQLNVSTTNPGSFLPPQPSLAHPYAPHANPIPTTHPQAPPPYYGIPGIPPPPSSVTQMSPGNGLSNSPLTPLQSPSSSMGSPPPLNLQGLGGQPNKICAICGDRASGKHYGVYSCEGCKGFFKRTVRKDLSYACRDDKKCLIDKRQRNRCQYCRYMKCIQMGMKREAVQEDRSKYAGDGSAVQEERNRGKDGKEEVESTSCFNNDMPVEKILEAELAVEPKHMEYQDMQDGIQQNLCQAADKQLISLVEWSKRIPHFLELPLDDQITLLRTGWNELLIAAFSHRSTTVKDGILLSSGMFINRNSAHQAGVGTIFDRVLTELVAKMRDMKMDVTELGCLRAIVLFNPDAKNLHAVQDVECLREKVYASLEEYCKSQFPDEPGRFAKLLLRLPALRSIGLKCIEHLFFFKLIGDAPIESFLMELLDNPNS